MDGAEETGVYKWHMPIPSTGRARRPLHSSFISCS
ncbi:hypothetical protein XHV734_4175 [Xanthomonas hortorum pv. vitians]|nr:hypothetical protein XHV734_4175 [Xanthomonas hortorum pv. vitians]